MRGSIATVAMKKPPCFRLLRAGILHGGTVAPGAESWPVRVRKFMASAGEFPDAWRLLLHSMSELPRVSGQYGDCDAAAREHCGGARAAVDDSGWAAWGGEVHA